MVSILNSDDNSSKIKISLIVVFLLTSLSSILTLITVPILGYPLSIYTEFSSYFWISSLLTIGIGIFIVIKNLENGWWKLGILVILLNNLTLLILPLLKGYAFSNNGDILTHLGYVNDILFTGHITMGNVYPITHIIIVEFSYLIGIPSIILMNLIGPMFYFLFVLFTYLLSKQLLNKNAAILSTLISTILVVYYYVQIFPMGFAFTMFPFVFYLYFKSINQKSISLSIILIIMLFLMVFFHPVAAAVLIFAFLIMELGKLVFNKFMRKNNNNEKKEFLIPLLLVISLIYWISNNSLVWGSTVGTIVSWFSFQLLAMPLTSVASEGLNKLNLNLIDILFLIIKLFGIQFSYLILFLIVSFKLIFRKDFSFVNNKRNFFIFWCFFSVAIVLWIGDYVLPLTKLSSGRMTSMIFALFPIIVGLAVYRFLTYNNVSYKSLGWSRRNRELTLCLTVFAFSIIGIFTLYPSPLVYNYNQAVDNMELSGGNWFINNSDSRINIIYYGGARPDRYKDITRGFSDPYQNKFFIPADHFGYDNSTYFGQFNNYQFGNKYMILRDQFILSLYDTNGIYSKIGRWNKEDFIKLDNDPTVNVLYENGEMEIYYIKR